MLQCSTLTVRILHWVVLSQIVHCCLPELTTANASCRISQIFTTCQDSDHTSTAEDYYITHEPNLHHNVNARAY